MRQLQAALRDGGGRGFALAGDLHGREGEFDAVLVERLLDHRVSLAANDELLARHGHHLRPDRDREIAELVDPLHLQGLKDQRRELRILLQVEPDLLDQLPRLFKVAVIGDTDCDLVDDPVAAHVLDRAQEVERHREDRAAVVPQPDGTNAEAFDGALITAGLDVFADPESIVHQIEHAGDNIAGEGLRAEPDRDTDDARTGNQRTDLNAQRRQRHHRGDDDDSDKQDVAKNRQQGAQARPPPRFVGVRLTSIGGLGELTIDRRFRGLPEKVGNQHDDDGAQHAVSDAADPCLLVVEVGEVDAPAPRQHRDRTDDQQRPNTALDAYGKHTRRAYGGLRRTRGAKQIVDRAPGDAYRERQSHGDQDEPEARHRMDYPEHPQQHDAHRQRRVGRAPPETMRHRRRRFVVPLDRSRSAPNRIKRDRDENEPERIGDQLARLQRVAEGDPEPDKYPTEGKPADKPNEPPPPETSGRRIHRNDAEPLVVRRQQEATDDIRDPHDEKSDEQAEQPLAQQRRPIEGKEGADAAERERHDQTDRKRKTQRDDVQALPHRF